MPRAAMSVATNTRVSPERKAAEGALALTLALVAVNGGKVDACLVERPGDAVGAALGARKHDDARQIRVVEQFDQQVALLRRLDEDDAVLDAVRSLGGRRHRDLDRIMQQFAGETADVGGHGRGEEQVLPLFRQFPHDAADRLDEAEIKHPVDFIEHQELDRAQVCDARVQMIDEPAGRRDQHVEARVERANLGAIRRAAEHGGDLQREPVRKVAEALRDLARQLARRGRARARALRLGAQGAGRSPAG